MTGQENIISHLDELFREQEASLNGKSGSELHEFQRRSFETLRQITFPDRKHEDWKYTAVQKLLSPKYKLPERLQKPVLNNIAGLDSLVIEIRNGQADIEKIRSGFAGTGIKIYSLLEAFSLPSWKEKFGKYIHPEKAGSNQTFDLLNFSFSANGFFLDVPANVNVEKLIEIRVIHESDELTFSHPLYFVHCRQQSKISIFERFEKPGSVADDIAGFINAMGILHLDAGAHVMHVKWQDLSMAQNMVYKLLVTQERDSHFETFACDYGGNVIRNNVEVDMIDSNTYTSLQGGYMARGNQSMDHQTRINHLVHHCESHEHYKGILDDQASAAFNGKVFVHQDAQKTNAYQQNDTLVLSSNAVMNSKPQLEIFADDVKCSHGATIGQLDDRALFYLRSRGINVEQATYILKAAFLGVIINKVANHTIRDYIINGMAIASELS